jgi:chromate reductase
MSKIAVIVGSLRRESINRKLAEALAKLAGPKAEFTFLKIDDLPLFNQDLEANPPAAVTRVKGQIEAADGVLIVTQYNRSIPGVLKMPSTGPRALRQNSFSGKPTAGIGASGGGIGTAAAQHLRSILAYLHVTLMGQLRATFSSNKGWSTTSTTSPTSVRKFLQSYVDAFTAWVDRYGKK